MLESGDRSMADMRGARMRVPGIRHREDDERHDLKDRQQRAPMGSGGRHDAAYITFPVALSMSFFSATGLTDFIAA